ncbi:hypothetical protein RCL_jg17206.t1 [Rhizophagus clarus]|uniref:Uncharacterized protein n=1 Tax=Rhizophagus clarus TaxID=94130 RepID=A0A8H3R288_9GLOM|nr:hypothetical protein RCL_jg17206.t1 [Rhizophagus clarus]
MITKYAQQKAAHHLRIPQVITFSNSVYPSSKNTLKNNDDKDKPSKDFTNDKGKKKKQDHLTDNFNNFNLILTGYNSLAQEQAQLLDLIVYDIPAKCDSYTLLGNFKFLRKDRID